MLVVAVIVTAIGFNRVRGPGMGGQIDVPGFVMLFGGVIVGIAAQIYRFYWRSRLRADAQKLAMETLSKLGRPKNEKNQVDKSN